LGRGIGMGMGMGMGMGACSSSWNPPLWRGQHRIADNRNRIGRSFFDPNQTALCNSPGRKRRSIGAAGIGFRCASRHLENRGDQPRKALWTGGGTRAF
jgi:hypothetical protein